MNQTTSCCSEYLQNTRRTRYDTSLNWLLTFTIDITETYLWDTLLIWCQWLEKDNSIWWEHLHSWIIKVQHSRCLTHRQAYNGVFHKHRDNVSLTATIQTMIMMGNNNSRHMVYIQIFIKFFSGNIKCVWVMITDKSILLTCAVTHIYHKKEFMSAAHVCNM